MRAVLCIVGLLATPTVSVAQVPAPPPLPITDCATSSTATL
jgi:hypothetical protein